MHCDILRLRPWLAASRNCIEANPGFGMLWNGLRKAYRIGLHKKISEGPILALLWPNLGVEHHQQDHNNQLGWKVVNLSNMSCTEEERLVLNDLEHAYRDSNPYPHPVQFTMVCRHMRCDMLEREKCFQEPYLNLFHERGTHRTTYCVYSDSVLRACCNWIWSLSIELSSSEQFGDE